MRRTTKFILISTALFASTYAAQQSYKFELSRSFSNPSQGPSLKGYIGSLHFRNAKNFVFSISSGYSEGEQAKIYLRDYKNSVVIYEHTESMKIIPVIIGVQYSLLKARKLEPFVEAEAGINLLRFDMSKNGLKQREYEVHLGIGSGIGINYHFTKYLQFVAKLKFNIATKVGLGTLFNNRTRYVTFLSGIKVAI